MNPAERDIRQRIRAKGAIDIAEFMQAALAGNAGYYARGRPEGFALGVDGDFITAPEISQIFGELIGAFAIDAWQRMGRPDPFRLIELGPGSGALMADLLRIARAAPDFLAALRLDLVERHPDLREAQRARLAPYLATDRGPFWHENFAAIPAGPAIVIANEFFDCLPIRQFVATPMGWRERVVTLAENRLAFALAAPGSAFALRDRQGPTAAIGAIVEISPAARDLAAAIARRLVAQGGIALIIDYGGSEGNGDTLQALRRHRKISPLDAPGEADLTAHVDFAALAKSAAAQGARGFGPRTQRDFLIALGIEYRRDRLAAQAAASDRAALDNQVRRLIDPAEMGTLFKVMAIAGPDIAELAGLS